MSTPPLELVEKLIARSASSFEEEARTSAFKACELIRRYHFAVVDPAMLPAPRPEIDRIVLVSKYSGRCKECGWRYRPGDRIAWAKGHGSICFECHREGGL